MRLRTYVYTLAKQHRFILIINYRYVVSNRRPLKDFFWSMQWTVILTLTKS